MSVNEMEMKIKKAPRMGAADRRGKGRGRKPQGRNQSRNAEQGHRGADGRPLHRQMDFRTLQPL